MSKYPVFDENLDNDRKRNIIRNALNWECFNNGPNSETRCDTTEVTIYNGTILACPIDNNQAVGETVHDFINLGIRCGGKESGGKETGKDVVKGYKTWLGVRDDFNGDKDETVYNSALSNIIDNQDITILTLNENPNAMVTARSLVGTTTTTGHVKPRSGKDTNPRSPTNSVSTNKDFPPDPSQSSVNITPNDTHTPLYNPESALTPASQYQIYLDSINEINLNNLKTALSRNRNNINVELLEVQDKPRFTPILLEIFEKKYKEPDKDVGSNVKCANDHGAKPFTSVGRDEFSVFNKMYDCRMPVGMVEPVGMVDPELLKLSYVYYSRNRTSGEIRGLLILLEEKNNEHGKKSDSRVNVKMKKYLFSCDSTMRTLILDDVSDIAPNVVKLCSEMNNRRLDAVGVALMKAAADRTLKIGALLSSVGLTYGIIYFLTHDIKNYYYNKDLLIKMNSREFKVVKLNAVYTNVYSRLLEQYHRRIFIYQQCNNLIVDPELRQLIDQLEINRQQIENLNSEIKKIEVLVNEAEKMHEFVEERISRYDILGVNTRDKHKVDMYNRIYNTYESMIGMIPTDYERLRDRNQEITKDKNPTNKDMVDKYSSLLDGITEMLKICNERLDMTSHDLTLTTIEEQELKKRIILLKNKNGEQSVSLDFSEESQNSNGKGGKEIDRIKKGGRRTRRSIKVITKRKIKVKSKTIKKNQEGKIKHEDNERNYDKIIRNVAKEILIDKEK